MEYFLQGLTMGLAYVAPIGLQNLFVINSALTHTRRRALLTALIVIFFDVTLAFACFFWNWRSHAALRVAANDYFIGGKFHCYLHRNRAAKSKSRGNRPFKIHVIHTENNIFCLCCDMVQSTGGNRWNNDVRRIPCCFARRKIDTIHFRCGCCVLPLVYGINLCNFYFQQPFPCKGFKENQLGLRHYHYLLWV